MASNGATKAARAIFQAFIRRPDSANVDTWAETIDREAVAPLRAFAQKIYDSTACVCKGKMGDIQRLAGTNVECTKCAAEAALKLAGGE